MAIFLAPTSHEKRKEARRAELTTVRDNLRYASIASASMYRHGDDVKRAKQIRKSLSARL